jgi:hypothetical protein
MECLMTTAEEARSWWAGKEILHPGMCDGRIDDWVTSLNAFKPATKDILEIGSFEGQSAVFWLRFFPDAHLTCIDHFQGTRGEHDGDEWGAKLARLEARFDCNVVEFGGRVRKLAMPSMDGLRILLQEAAKFDLIYIDGDHSLTGAESDTRMAWQCLRPGGLMIWDDYGSHQDVNCVKQFVDAFIDSHWYECRPVHELVMPSGWAQQKFAVKLACGQLSLR